MDEKRKSLLGLHASNILFAGSLRELKAKTAGLIGCLMPVYGVALAWLVPGEVPTLTTVPGGLVIVGGGGL